MTWGLRRYSHEYDKERYQACPQRQVTNCWQNLAIAIEEEAEGVNDLVRSYNMLGLDRAACCQPLALSFSLFEMPKKRTNLDGSTDSNLRHRWPPQDRHSHS